MALRVPVSDVLHVRLAVGSHAIAPWVRLGGPSENFAPVFAAPESISGVERVAGFVAQNSQSPFAIAPLDFAHVFLLEAS